MSRTRPNPHRARRGLRTSVPALVVAAALSLGFTLVAPASAQQAGTHEIWIDPGPYAFALSIDTSSSISASSCPEAITHRPNISLRGDVIESTTSPYLWCTFTTTPSSGFPAFQYLAVTGTVSSADGHEYSDVQPCAIVFPYQFTGSGPTCDALSQDFYFTGSNGHLTISFDGYLDVAPQMERIQSRLTSVLETNERQCDNTPPANGGNIVGTAGDDVLCGGPGADTITAGGGNDVVYGGGGDDDISTGSGDDIAFGGPGNDSLRCGSGDDFCGGGRGDDVVAGGPGYDIVNGASGTDSTNDGTGNGLNFSGEADK